MPPRAGEGGPLLSRIPSRFCVPISVSSGRLHRQLKSLRALESEVVVQWCHPAPPCAHWSRGLWASSVAWDRVQHPVLWLSQSLSLRRPLRWPRRCRVPFPGHRALSCLHHVGWCSLYLLCVFEFCRHVALVARLSYHFSSSFRCQHTLKTTLGLLFWHLLPCVQVTVFVELQFGSFKFLIISV